MYILSLSLCVSFWFSNKVVRSYYCWTLIFIYLYIFFFISNLLFSWLAWRPSKLFSSVTYHVNNVMTCTFADRVPSNAQCLRDFRIKNWSGNKRTKRQTYRTRVLDVVMAIKKINMIHFSWLFCIVVIIIVLVEINDIRSNERWKWHSTELAK